MVRPLVRAWGSADLGPEATIVGNGCHSLRIMHRERPGFDPQPLDRSFAQNSTQTIPNTLLVYLDVSRRPYLGGRLRRVAKIRNQDAGILPHQQKGGGAGKASEVANVGEMGDQHPIQPLRIESPRKGGLPLQPPVRWHAVGSGVLAGPEGSSVHRSR
jgi:hypothetical protein